MKAPRIGIVLPYLKSRGTENQALRLAIGFREHGVRTVLFVSQGWGIPDMYRAFAEAQIEVVNVGPPIDEGQKKARLTRTAALIKHVRHAGCTVLLSRAGMTNQMVGLAARYVGIPAYVVLSRAVIKKPATGIKGWLKSMKRWWDFGFAHNIIAVSEEGAMNFGASFELLKYRIYAIHNGVALQQKMAGGSPENEIIWVTSGSLELHRKGLDTLLAAIGLIKDKSLLSIKLQVWLLGSGPDEEKIREEVKRNGLEDWVILKGEQKDPLSMMRSCHGFLLPSRREGLPNALLEAMSISLPCIAADCRTGPKEIIRNGENGLLVPVNEPEALAEAIIRLSSNEAERNKLASKGRETIGQHFNQERMIREYLTLLTSGS